MEGQARVILDGVEYDFGIRSGVEGYAVLFEFPAQFDVVIDFPVEHDPDCPFGVGHRLVSFFAQIEDRQAPEGQSEVGLEVVHQGLCAALDRLGGLFAVRVEGSVAGRMHQQVSFVVGSPVPDHLPHALEPAGVHWFFI